MTHLAAAIFFALSLVAALAALHVMVQLSWREIALALRGELGREVSRPTAPAVLAPRRRAAF